MLQKRLFTILVTILSITLLSFSVAAQDMTYSEAPMLAEMVAQVICPRRRAASVNRR
jgi:uncharacterized membrane protein YqhA